jgi:hypothetical protein
VCERIDKTGERVDRVTANVGGLNRSLGELIETLIAACLWEKFPEYDLRRAYQRIPSYDEKRIPKTNKEEFLMIKKRDLLSYILLSMITCGIYGLWRIHVLARDLNIIELFGNLSF